jgi:hypothetical protein
LNTAGVAVLLHFHASAYLAGVIMVVPVGLSSFFLNKRLVFRGVENS